MATCASCPGYVVADNKADHLDTHGKTPKHKAAFDAYLKKSVQMDAAEARCVLHARKACIFRLMLCCVLPMSRHY